ncbi:5'-nucleotidase [Algoriphagus ratkowskyi]|uniref:5'-nucleotidase n=1 Tax=Algoriphagus ratkowskyi TaxID=57028 RepID=A0A2W7RK31_9BACT|nr:bifunctional metallophosphatase/5'-nucleotidase [Algoriphagus ratkowskyi]PZX55937.1 5'-nucleotidase [Algoriphagus ratkowskyi]TXD77249.1 bifunctional metallophosphatase/5'-nucleotidase [Algoriphagus ratkowskyi]
MILDILFINDVHGYIAPHSELFYDENGEYVAEAGGYARLYTKVEEIKKNNPNTLLFDGGDTFHGTKPIVDTKGQSLIPILNKMGFDAMTSHWDFAYGPEHLKNLTSQLNYPHLACNIFNQNGELFTSASKIYEVEDVKIGVIGVAAFIVDKVMPSSFAGELSFTNGIKEVNEEIKKLNKEGADLIVLLSHNGLPQDMELLKKIDGIDICLSAHTHNRIYTPLKVNGALVIQCGCHGSFLGKMKLDIQDGSIQSHQYELITIDNKIEENAEMKALVDSALENFAEISKNYVGKTTQLLHRYTTVNANLDELMHQGACFVTNTDICFSNGWRYGAPIAEGFITENDLYNMAPMNPPISVVELTGREIKEMLEENLSRTFACDPMKQMGGYAKRIFGLHLNIRIENPDGEKIQELFYKGDHLEMDETYKTSFITVQGVPSKYGKNRKESEFKLIESIKMYLEKHSPFSPLKNPTYRLV